MKRMVTALLVVALLFVVAPVYAANVERFDVKGESVVAYFSSSPDGCVWTYVRVDGFEQAVRQNGPHAGSESSAGVYMEVFDECLGFYEHVIFGSVSLESDAFGVDKQLANASLEAEIPAHDYIEEVDVLVSIVLDWSANGKASKSSSQWKQRADGFSFREYFKGTFMPALVSGSVAVDGNPIDLGDEPIGTIMLATSGYLVTQNN